SVLAVSSHRAHGGAFAIALLRGMVLGRFSFVAFCLVLAFALRHASADTAWLGFAAASATAMAVQWATRRMARAQGSAAKATEIAAAPDAG
ncbi:hypothetical protein G3N92_34135, partial [Burkholderia sp. Ac-20379]|nr:hypothetical protein [Burkholderia sp. Ac-20379]